MRSRRVFRVAKTRPSESALRLMWSLAMDDPRTMLSGCHALSGSPSVWVAK